LSDPATSRAAGPDFQQTGGNASSRTRRSVSGDDSGLTDSNPEPTRARIVSVTNEYGGQEKL